ncbi:Hypothetical predicted protein, partial [Pelobates cultripes]
MENVELDTLERPAQSEKEISDESAVEHPSDLNEGKRDENEGTEQRKRGSRIRRALRALHCRFSNIDINTEREATASILSSRPSEHSGGLLQRCVSGLSQIRKRWKQRTATLVKNETNEVEEICADCIEDVEPDTQERPPQNEKKTSDEKAIEPLSDLDEDDRVENEGTKQRKRGPLLRQALRALCCSLSNTDSSMDREAAASIPSFDPLEHSGGAVEVCQWPVSNKEEVEAENYNCPFITIKFIKIFTLSILIHDFAGT